MEYRTVRVTDQEIQLAKELDKKVNNRYSHDKENAWHGKLAEIKFHQLYPQCQWSDTYEYDFITPLNNRVDIKCGSGSAKYGSHNRLEILEHQKGYQSDLYYFTRYIRSENIIEMYGAIRSDVYWQHAEFSPAGSPIGGGKVRYESAYFIRGWVFEKNRIETIGGGLPDSSNVS